MGAFMLTGNYILLDIGSQETKIMEAQLKGNTITIFNITHMRDMSLFVSKEGLIQQTQGFCQSLRATLNNANIKTKRVIVCSDILSIAIQDISSEYSSVKECRQHFSRDYNKSSDYSIIRDWHFAGDTKLSAASALQRRIYLATASVDVLTDFIKNMKSIAGLTVVNIESNFTAQCNLRGLYSPEYDLPSVAFVDLGNTCAHCHIFKHGALVCTQDINSSLFSCTDYLAKRLKKPNININYILHTVGLTDSQKSYSILATEGIDPSDYFSAVKEVCTAFVQDFQRALSEINTIVKLENVQVVWCGGFMAVPGLADFIQSKYTYTPCRVLHFGTTFSSRTVSFINQSNKDITPEFVNCIGLCLKPLNSEHNVNLCPNKKEYKNEESKLSLFLSSVSHEPLFGMIVACFFVVILIITFGINSNSNTSVVTVSTPFYQGVKEYSLTYGTETKVSLAPAGINTDSNQNFTYSEYDSSVIAVSDNGLVTPLAVGETTVKIHRDATADEGAFDTIVPVHVLKGTRSLKFSDIHLQSNTSSVPFPYSLGEENVHIISQNPNVVSVVDGRLFPLVTGTAALQISYPETSLYIAENYTLYVTVYPDIQGIVANTNVISDVGYVYFDVNDTNPSLSFSALSNGVIKNIEVDDSNYSVNTESTTLSFNFADASQKIFDVHVQYGKTLKSYRVYAIKQGHLSDLQISLTDVEGAVYAPVITGDLIEFKVPNTFVSGVLNIAGGNNLEVSGTSQISEDAKELSILLINTNSVSYNFVFNAGDPLNSRECTVAVTKGD